ncbi:NAD-dependent epimerase/dehydratase [Tremella mesenterica]|uniref:NAD-dependent epimerase/dehydratase n=1 Tax=Tremella mesenterica TaxID=5217 RepID=A0A4Q1BJE6_TREME|nr:uncharacterized protein TREMEDRAFT_45034 [Tremella mesenterica DSM 1558]EIW68076.1 hypothetical protein TREMEDRAFT_45034 [Tremella mesenterica DSM 1558]RXK37742.1 NAD-dependent epimerase/dehydratase [Tremella mesenterica]
MSSSYDALVLPSHVKTVLITGAGGFVGQQLTQLLLQLYPSIRLITVDINVPPTYGITDSNKLKSVKADLGDLDQVKSLFEGETIGGVFALHGIMSGGAEANFDLGYAVNVDAHLNVLKTAVAHAATFPEGEKTVYVFASSLAVYGGPKCRPQDLVVPADTPLIPETSYGCQKQIIETYAYDYGRRGMLDTRCVRLPTVAIRSGAPSTAASSFISGLIREPLLGQISECPIASGPDDPILDQLPVYLSRTKTVIRNLVWALCMPQSSFKERVSRSLNLPGISILPRDILNALVEHGGEEALKLVHWKRDPVVVRICLTWPGDFDSSESVALGFEQDDTKTGFSSAVGDFKELLVAQAK